MSERRAPRLPWSLTWLVWLAPAALFSPVLLTGRALFWGTPALQFVPWRYLAWQTLRQGGLPLWNPLSGMGAPLLANYQSALLYPPNWLLFGLHGLGDFFAQRFPANGQDLGLGLAAWGQALLVVLHLGWAGWGMVLLARRLGLGSLAQTVSGLAFGMSGYLVARAGFLSINAAAAWLPWVVLASEQLRSAHSRDSRWRALLTASLVFALLLLAGHAQTAWYSLMLAGLWSLARAGWQSYQDGKASGRDKPAGAAIPGALQALTWLGLAGLLAGLMAAAQLLPTGEYLQQSQRLEQVDYSLAMTYSFWPWHFITLLAPGFFGSPASGDYWGYANYWEDAVYLGLLPLLLALSTVLSAARQRLPAFRLSLGLLLLALVSFWLALGDNTPLFPWLFQHVPTFDMFQAPARYTLWAEFSIALLAGIGAQTWRRPQRAALYWTRLGSAGALAVTVGTGLAWRLLGDVSPTFIKAGALAGVLGLAAGLLSLGALPGETARSEPFKEPPLRRFLRAVLPAGRISEGLLGAGSAAAPVKESRLGRLSERYGRSWRKVWPSLVVILIAVDLLAAGWGLNPAVAVDFYTKADALPIPEGVPSGSHRLYLPRGAEEKLKFERFFRFDSFDPGLDWRQMRAVLLPNLNLLTGTISANNFDPLIPGRYAVWMQLLEAAQQPFRQVLLNLMDVGAVENIVDRAEQLVQFDTITGSRRWRWLPCAVQAADDSQALELVKSAGEALLTQTVILEAEGLPEGAVCEPGAAGEAEFHLVKERPGSLDLIIDAPASGWVLIADTWYPGWSARLDGADTQLYRANYLFQAVRVPAGEQTLSLRYRPRSFLLGAALSTAALVFWLCAWAWGFRKAGKKRRAA